METTNKGRTTKEYFPNVAERLQKKNLTQNFTTLVTGHGNLKTYLHRFKIIEAPDCPCGNGNQRRNTYYSIVEYYKKTEKV